MSVHAAIDTLMKLSKNDQTSVMDTSQDLVAEFANRGWWELPEIGLEMGKLHILLHRGATPSELGRFSEQSMFL